MPIIIAFFVYLAILAAVVYGYVLNIIDIVHTVMVPNVEVTLLLVVRVIGLFVVPLGTILGYVA